MGPRAARERALVPARRGWRDPCEPTAAHPASSRSTKPGGDLPTVAGQTPARFEGRRAVPEGRRAVALAKESTGTGDTARGQVKPKCVSKVKQVPTEKRS